MSNTEEKQEEDKLLKRIKRELPEDDLEFDFDKPPDHPDPLEIFAIKVESESDCDDDSPPIGDTPILNNSKKVQTEKPAEVRLKSISDNNTPVDFYLFLNDEVKKMKNESGDYVLLVDREKLKGVLPKKDVPPPEAQESDGGTSSEDDNRMMDAGNDFGPCSSDDDENLSSIKNKLHQKTETVPSSKDGGNSKCKTLKDGDNSKRLPSKKELDCSKCNKRFRYRASLKKHLREQHSITTKETITTADGGKETVNPTKAKKHACVICKMRFETMNLYEEHFKKEHNADRPYQCCVCKQFYHSKSNMLRHRTTHPEYRSEAKPQKRFECEICGKKLLAKSYKMHMNQHLGQDLFECEICHRKFAAAFILRKHMRVHTNPRNKCEICGKILKLKTQMDEHMVSHGLEKKYVCDMCGDKFVSQRTLNAHILTHKERDPLECRYCGKLMEDFEQLDAHIIGEHKVPPKPVDPTKSFLCDICGKELISKSAMRNHKLSHTGERPHQCDYCNKSFTSPRYLMYHKRIHNGYKPYVCKHCDKGFSSNHSLQKHERVHIRGTPYSCEHCDKKFASKKVMEVHVNSHERKLELEKVKRERRERLAARPPKPTTVKKKRTKKDSKNEQDPEKVITAVAEPPAILTDVKTENSTSTTPLVVQTTVQPGYLDMYGDVTNVQW